MSIQKPQQKKDTTNGGRFHGSKKALSSVSVFGENATLFRKRKKWVKVKLIFYAEERDDTWRV